MKILQKTDSVLYSLNLDGWAERFWQLYKNQNINRTIPEIWLAAIQSTSVIAEGVRKNTYGEVKKGITHLFSWICAFYNQCTIHPNRESHYSLTELDFSKYASFKKYKPSWDKEPNLWKIIAFKFPGRCGRCCVSPCNCGLSRVGEFIGKHSDFPKEIKMYRKNFTKDGQDSSLEDWTSLFTINFSNSIYRSSIENICFHLMEEAGEVARAIRALGELAHEPRDKEERKVFFEKQKMNKEDLIEEMADTFSFLVAIAIKLSFIEISIRNPHYSSERLLEMANPYFVNILIKEFADPSNPDEICCSECKHNPCDCVNYFKN